MSTFDVILRCSACAGLIFACANPVRAQLIDPAVVTMDELPTQFANGVSLKGVTFTDTANALFDFSDGGQERYVQDPSLEGPTTGETLTMTFTNPVAYLQFGVALSTLTSVDNGFTVTLFDPAGNQIGAPISVNTQPYFVFSEGLFTSPAISSLIKQAVVTFNSAAAGSFAVDNVTFGVNSFQVRYAANLQFGESYIDISNNGANGAPLLGPGFGTATGNICVNVYAFDPSEELISCCSCLVTPGQTVDLAVNRDLTSKTLTGVVPGSVTVKLLATLAGAGGSAPNCNNSAANVTSSTIVPGMGAFGTTLHATPTAGAYATTETPFTTASLSAGELASIGGRCASMIGNASGFGICSSCRAGALGAAKQ